VNILKCILVQKVGFFKNIQDSCTVTKLKRVVGCFSNMCLCNFDAFLSQYISLFVPCDLRVFWYPLQFVCLWFTLICRIRSWKSLASVDILVSVDAIDSIAAFGSEKITAFSNLSWCKFNRRSVVRMASISPSKAVECYPSGM